jgi:hypothetical protein
MSKVDELSVEAKLAITIRLAELIEQTRDPETLGGLRMIFSSLVKDLTYPKVH